MTTHPLNRTILGAILTTFFFLALGVPSPSAAAVYDPALRWHTITTPHFRIHHPEELAGEAERLAGIAEEVHPVLASIAGWEPEGLTEVTLVDNTDLANGYTTVFPYDQIVLFAVEPEWAQSVADYGDWLRMVFVHEYAHVLGLSARRGYAKVFESVFGRVDVPLTVYGALFWFLAAPPNVFLPPWFHEGLAVNLESGVAGRGRKDSTYYDMIYRTDVAEGALPPLDRLGGDFPDWPSYSTRYIYGARLLGLVEKEYGREALGKLVTGHSGRFPYTIDRPPTLLSGDSYQGLYRRMTEDLAREYGPEIEKLRAEGVTPVEEVTRAGFSDSAPLWLDDDTLVFTRKSTTSPTELAARTFSTGEERTLALRPGGDTRPTRDGQGRVVFTRVEVEKPTGNLFLDLYAVRPDGWWVRRLTSGARLRYADGSPGGSEYAGVVLDGPAQRLVRFTLERGEARETVLLAEPGVRYDSPRWSPDGKRIAFTRKETSGTERLTVLDLSTGTTRSLTPEGSRAGFPAWSPDGRKLAFTWDVSGVFDLYVCDLETGSLRRLTRLVGGAFEPDWSPDGKRIAFSNYSSKGFHIALLQLSDTLDGPIPAAAKPAAPLPAARATAPKEEPAPEPAPGETAEPAASTPYSPWRRLVPSFWLPDLIGDNGGAAPGAWTSAHDPLYRHNYFVSAYWSLELDRLYGYAAYVYDGSYPTVTVQAMKLPWLHADLLPTSDGGEADYWEEVRSAGIEVRQDIPNVLRYASVAAAWRWEEVVRLSRIGEDLWGDPALAELAFEGRQNPLTLSLTYDSAFPYTTPFTVGAESGRFLDVSFRWRSDATGSERDSREWLGEWREYRSVPGLDRHVLALRGKGAVGHGDATLQSLFQLGGPESEFPLRGYPDRVARGEKVLTGSAEYRFPLWSPYRGILDWPAFLGKLHGAAFFDMGKTWADGGDEPWRRGAGAELRIDTVLGYYFATTFTVGYGHGFDDDGADYGYVRWLGVF